MRITRSGVVLTPQEWEQLVDSLASGAAIHNAYYGSKIGSDRAVSSLHNIILDALDALNGTDEFSKMKDEVDYGETEPVA